MTSARPREVETLRRLVEAVNRDGLDGALALIDETVHPDIEWSPVAAREVEGRNYRGRDGMGVFWNDFFGAFESVRYEDNEYRLLGEGQVLWLTRVRVCGRGSTLEIDQELGVVLEFEDALARRGVSYGSHDDAIAAAEAISV